MNDTEKFYKLVKQQVRYFLLLQKPAWHSKGGSDPEDYIRAWNTTEEDFWHLSLKKMRERERVNFIQFMQFICTTTSVGQNCEHMQNFSSLRDLVV